MPSPRGDRRVKYRPKSRRRILCVFPRYAPSFGTFQHAYRLLPRVRAFMPPQGLLLIAAYLPPDWEVRFIDGNVRLPGPADYRWADAVFISGMHIQRSRINAINAAAHRYGKVTVLGGPSVSACADYYPQVDLLHVGELGDATDALIAYLDTGVARPAKQRVFATAERLPLDEFPIPAYGLVDMHRYLLGNIQFSSGCPYQCEFFDIPELYDRRPRLKTPEQVTAELDAIVAAGLQGAIYFVDDNFIGNRKATRQLLPHLIAWQRARGYPLKFNCEATLNIAQWDDILEQMREARFVTVFCGIETPESEALRFMHKEQNLRQPIVDAVRKINAYGMEVVGGIILGLDTDTPQTVDHVLRFIEASQIPMLTINLLYALPKTPLYRRLHGAPGVSFVIVRRAALPEKSAGRSVYLDLARHHHAQDAGDTAFTPAVPVFYALCEALRELADQGGWRVRHQRYRGLATAVEDGLVGFGVEPLLRDGERSVVLRAYHLPAGLDYAALHDGLKQRGFVIYAGQGKLAASIFRVSTMGAIDAADMQRFLDAVAGLLGTARHSGAQAR